MHSPITATVSVTTTSASMSRWPTCPLNVDDSHTQRAWPYTCHIHWQASSHVPPFVLSQLELLTYVRPEASSYCLPRPTM